MLDSLNQEFIKTARAKGLKNSKIIFKHALRNALIPVITYLGPQVAFTLCGGERVLHSRAWAVFCPVHSEPGLPGDHGDYGVSCQLYYFDEYGC